jgi:hypothetical protein
LSDNTSLREEDEPLRCYGLGNVQDQAELLANIFELEKKPLNLAVDCLVQILNVITLRYDGVGTIHNGFDIVAISEKGDIYEKYRFQKKDLKSKITIKNDKTILSSFEKTDLEIKPKIIKPKRKSKVKPKNIVKLEISKDSPELVTGFELEEMLKSKPTLMDPFTFPKPKCTECGTELDSSYLHSIYGGKCASCFSKI